ncbi:uncharacterized protein LOC144346275 [Saccoglossus kowalevskii]
MIMTILRVYSLLLTIIYVCISVVHAQVDVRLFGGHTPFEGRVEIRKDNGEWGLICAMKSQTWDSIEARVVCKQLGFVGVMWTWSNSEYGVSNLPVNVCDISCDVSATSLNDCTISNTGSCNNCQHNQAGVTCYCEYFKFKSIIDWLVALFFDDKFVSHTLKQTQTGLSNVFIPGFLGRYKEGLNSNRTFPISSNMYTHGNSITTIQGCIQTCRDNSKPIAVLESADECYCGDDDTDYRQYGEAIYTCATIGACGGQFTGHSGYIYSPNYPGKYPDDQNCIWTITVEDNHIIQLNILMDNISVCDFLDIKDGGDVIAPLITWHNMTVYSTGNILWLQFYSDSYMDANLGFALTYQAVVAISTSTTSTHDRTTDVTHLASHKECTLTTTPPTGSQPQRDITPNNSESTSGGIQNPNRRIDSLKDGYANEEHGSDMNEFASDDMADYDVIDKNYKRNNNPIIAVVEPFPRDINVTDDGKRRGKPATGVQKQRDPEIAEINMEADDTLANMYACVTKPKRRSTQNRNVGVESASPYDDVQTELLVPIRLRVDLTANPRPRDGDEIPTTQSPGESDVDDAVLFLPNPLKDGNRGARTTEKTADNYEGFVDCAIYQSAEGAYDDENNSQSQEGFVDNVIYESM